MTDLLAYLRDAISTTPNYYALLGALTAAVLGWIVFGSGNYTRRKSL